MNKKIYINPLTDFGFKKLFGTEPNKGLLKEREAYEESLKYYRDLKNVVDTSRQEGFDDGIEQGIEKGIEQGIEKTARKMKSEGFTNDQIKKITGLADNEIEKL